ncbi:MAG: hypothetical protein CME62_02925 [Halobacteriovoraceae bacterium]|nr:hypothetical protein [Halobacteriovoraceae bacterium]|tara:strand:+ start:6048 stop:7379 length:1332 start_codon:yes stop_codon:yes gene_type:complete
MLSHQKFQTLLKPKHGTLTYNFTVNDNETSGKNVFIAIVGERYNPLEHLQKLTETSIKYIICEQKYESLCDNQHFEYLFVDDINKTIGELGRLIAEDFQEKNNSIIAISGSNGKTTTKEMLSSILKQELGPDKVISTQKNFNNHLGVPFTLFQITSTTQYAVVELGSNAPGEIAYLAQMLKPDYSFTTNIGDTHLEFFGTRQAVFEEEASVARFTQKTFFKNNNDPFLKSLKLANELSLGLEDSTIKVELSFGKAFVDQVELKNEFITGEHNFFNLACALIIAHELLDVTWEKLAEHAQKFRPTANRSQWLEWDNKQVFLDAYNSNPSSLKTALKGFADYLEQHNVSKKDAAVIVGDMNELGENSDHYHRESGEYVQGFDFGLHVFVGRYADLLAGDKRASHTLVAKDVNEFIQKYSSELKPFKYLFIKGSRSLQLERIPDIK